MKCEEIESLIIDYLDGKLNRAQAAEIERHLETCEKCLDELKETQQMLKMISEEEEVNPDESLRINFYHMLHNEIGKSDVKSKQPDSSKRIRWFQRTFYQVAAGIALLIAGTFAGMLIYSGIARSAQQKEISELRTELNSLKKTAMLTMLKDGSSSYRIEALNYAEQIDSPDQNIIDVLVKTLNNDKNINVRMTAAYALSRYANMELVRDSLVKSLSIQTDPILQVTLINILVDLREKNAIKPIERIISDKGTIQDVKRVAENGVKLLL